MTATGKGRLVDGALAVLMAAVDQAFERKSWHGPNLRGKTTARDLILGAAAHDLYHAYHAGQIQLLKHLQSSPA